MPARFLQHSWNHHQTTCLLLLCTSKSRKSPPASAVRICRWHAQEGAGVGGQTCFLVTVAQALAGWCGQALSLCVSVNGDNTPRSHLVCVLKYWQNACFHMKIRDEPMYYNFSFKSYSVQIHYKSCWWINQWLFLGGALMERRRKLKKTTLFTLTQEMQPNAEWSVLN